MKRLLTEQQPRAVINFAVENHLDRLIYGPEELIQTNVLGTYKLLEALRVYKAVFWIGVITLISEVPLRAIATLWMYLQARPMAC